MCQKTQFKVEVVGSEPGFQQESIVPFAQLFWDQFSMRLSIIFYSSSKPKPPYHLQSSLACTHNQDTPTLAKRPSIPNQRLTPQ
jgi:hypothetical protein